MGQIPQQLGRAFGSGAAHVGPVLVPFHRGPAHGACLGQEIGPAVRRALVQHHGQHLRDDLPRLAHQHCVPDADVLVGDKVLVVQRGAGDGGARQTHRLQHRLGGEHAGAAHLHHDIGEPGGLHLRRVLIGGGPPGELGRGAQHRPLAQIVYLYHRPVDVKGEPVPLLPDLSDGPGHLVHGGTQLVGDDLKALLGQIVQRLLVGLKGGPVAPLHVEHQNVQLPLGGDPGILLAEGAGGGVAGIGEQGLAPALPLVVQGVEHLFGHEHLAPDDEMLRRTVHPQGDGPHGAQVGGHVLPHLAIPPGGPPDEQAVFIFQSHGQAVHFRLHHIDGPRHRALHPLVKGPHLVKVEHVLKGFQGHPVLHRLKGRQGLSPHPLGGRVGGHRLRVGLLQLLQTAELVVIVVVGHGGLVQHIVLIARPLQLPAQLVNFRVKVHCRHLLFGIEIRRSAGETGPGPSRTAHSPPGPRRCSAARRPRRRCGR